MRAQWCYTRDGRMTLGPVTWEELQRLAASGDLLPTDVVGGIGMAEPVRAGRVPGLFASFGGHSRPMDDRAGPGRHGKTRRDQRVPGQRDVP